MTRKFIPAVLIIFLMAFSFTACKKDKADVEQPDTDLAASVAGTYDLSYLKVQTDNNDESDDFTKNVPFDTDEGEVTGVVEVKKTGEETVTVVMILERAGQTVGRTPFGKEVLLKEEGGAVAMYISTDKIGTIDGDNLDINISGGDGELRVKARK